MKALVAASLAAGLLFAAPATFASQELAKNKGCLACHQLQKAVVGPAYKDVAAKYAGQADAVDKLSNSILKGSTGVWKMPMPMMPPQGAPTGKVTPEEAKQLAEWVLTIK
ncbi:MAG: c-type cytochrome [Rhodocyclaceae bacterium]|nr:c-type cytochrome [Rhodocyclaceae bacterium]MCB1962486.1 c-type cytochrome [Rhodocyclaceae bacterium]